MRFRHNDADERPLPLRAPVDEFTAARVAREEAARAARPAPDEVATEAFLGDLARVIEAAKAGPAPTIRRAHLRLV